MGYYSEGRGSAEKVNIEKAKELMDKYKEYGGLELNLLEDEALLELEFQCGSWYYEDDFPKDGEEASGPGVFRDLRDILTTEPAALSFTDQYSERYLVLITPPGATKPYMKVEMIYRPNWEQVPEEYAEVVKRWFGVCKTASCECEKITKEGGKQKLIDREMEKFDTPQE